MMLSLIVPLYNVEPYIYKCVMSLITQLSSKLGVDYEVIFVNDGSTDRSFTILSELIQTVKGVVVIDQENQGLSVARNNGLKVASGDYVWFIDSDDWISEDAVSIITHKLNEHHFDVIKIRAYNYYSDGLIKPRQGEYDEKKVRSGRNEGISTLGETPVQFNIMRREWMFENELCFMPNVFHEDNEFTPRMYWFADQVGFINTPLYFYRQNPTSITASSNPKKSFDLLKVCNSLESFIKRNHVIQNRRFYTALCGLIGLSLNNALNNIEKQDIDSQYKLEQELRAKPHLLKYLWYSRQPKYMLEYFLCKLSGRYLSVYKTLKKLHPKRGN